MTRNYFIALEILNAPEEFSWHFLSPRIMQWGDGIFIMDLAPTQGYWRVCAERSGLRTIDFLRETLETKLGESKDRFRAVLAEHPWRAILLLNLMKERGLYGVLCLETSFGQSLYRGLTWESWLLAAREIAGALEAVKFPRFHRDVFYRNIKLLQASTKRLQILKPSDLSEAKADALAVNRRFGPVLSLLWDFSFGAEGAQSFPWVPWQPLTKPSVKRHLDFAIWHWESVEPILREDFDRLCALKGWTLKEKILTIVWTLTDDGLMAFDVAIRFRNPHSLHKESGRHTTALLQSSYAFMNFQRNMEKSAEASDQEPRPIVSWQLTIEEKILPPPLLQELFKDLDSAHFDEEISAIENQLPIELRSFQPSQDWLPEHSCLRIDSQEAPEAADLTPWLRLARNRPLFLYDAPLSFDAQDIARRVFLERVSGKWWETEADGASQRDYYQLSDRNNQVRWVYRDESGSWFLHGIYH